jgi:hypothetical protein
MNKRIEKRHKRQVARAKARVRLSEPDVRTPEQRKAAREASQPDAGQRAGEAPRLRTSTRKLTGPANRSGTKTDA